MNWLHYLAEATLYLAIFYLAYCLLFSRETHYQLNRFYLLFSCVAAFALPVLQVGVLKPTVKPVDMADAYAILADRMQETPLQLQVQTVLPLKQENLAASQIKSKPEIKQSATSIVVPTAKPQLSPVDYLWYAYLLGAAIMLILLLIRLTSLFLLARRASSVKYGKYKLVQLPGTNVAFSFFGYLFLGDNAPATDTIITHELVHIRQKHSADIIFLELLKIMNWFNPFIYLLQNSLKAVHEYIADQAASHQTDTLTYATFLVDTAHGIGGSAITHSFFNYNLLKKRIIMLNQKPSGKSARLKYLITAPICAGLLCVSTLAFPKNYSWIDLDPAKAVTAVIKPLLHQVIPAKHEEKPQAAPAIAQPVQTAQAVVSQSDDIKSDDNNNAPASGNDDVVYKPFVSNGGYYALAHYLHKNIHYTPAADDKGAAVQVGFKLDNNLKITDLKLESSAGDKLDNLVLDAFKNYKGTVNDDAGKNLNFTVYFYTGNYDVLKSKTSEPEGSSSGAILVTASPYKFNVTPKGYEYDEIPVAKAPFGPQANIVWIYLKDGGYEYYQQNLISDSQAALLKNKYGYSYPSNSYGSMVFLPAVNGNKDKYSWTAMDIPSHLTEPYTTAFYKHIYDNLQYPEAERANLKTGVVLVKFNLDQSGMINNVGVAKSAGAAFDQAAVDAVKSFTGGINDNEGEHTIAIVFCLTISGSRPAVSDSFKKDGYVGELAHSERKSAFDAVHFTASKTSDNTDKK